MTLELALWIVAGLWLLGTVVGTIQLGRKLTTDSLGFRFIIAFIAWPGLLLSWSIDHVAS